MLLTRKLQDDLYYLGGNDRRLSRFENMFTLPRGVSYNSYLLIDEKTVVFDAVDKVICEVFYEQILEALDGRPLDYLVCNHVEPDHAEGICYLMERYPDLRLIISPKGDELLRQFHRRLDFSDRIEHSSDGFVLECGKHRIRFLTAPNVHWPEVTVAFDETSGTLFSADAFGSFGAPAGHLFADQVSYERDWLAETRRYYCNIVGRQGLSVQKLLKKCADLEIRSIYPLHGLLFRTPETIHLILEKYARWSAWQAEDAGVCIVYGSMYDHSAQLADILAAKLADKGVPEISIFDISETNVSEVIAEAFRLSNLVLICNNYNTELYPKMDAFLRELMMLNWDQHSVSYLGNKSWGGRGVKIAQEIMSKAKNLRTVGDVFTITSSLDASQEAELEALADAIFEDVSQEEQKALN